LFFPFPFVSLRRSPLSHSHYQPTEPFNAYQPPIAVDHHTGNHSRSSRPPASSSSSHTSSSSSHRPSIYGPSSSDLPSASSSAAPSSGRKPKLPFNFDDENVTWESMKGSLAEIALNLKGKFFLSNKLNKLAYGEVSNEIFQEFLSSFTDLAKDSIGNYSIQALLDKLTPEQLVNVIEIFQQPVSSSNSHFLYFDQLSTDKSGAFVIEKVLRILSPMIMKGWKRINHVNNSSERGETGAGEREKERNQELEEKIVFAYKKFIKTVVECVSSHFVEVSQNRYTSHIIQILFQSFPLSFTASLYEKAMKFFDQLVYNQYGNYILQEAFHNAVKKENIDDYSSSREEREGGSTGSSGGGVAGAGAPGRFRSFVFDFIRKNLVSLACEEKSHFLLKRITDIKETENELQRLVVDKVFRSTSSSSSSSHHHHHRSSSNREERINENLVKLLSNYNGTGLLISLVRKGERSQVEAIDDYVRRYEKYEPVFREKSGNDFLDNLSKRMSSFWNDNRR
jgi:hypothetical protein